MITALQQHDRMEGEVVQVTRDGRRITVSSHWALDRDAEGRPGAILTTYNDITARKQVEAERAPAAGDGAGAPGRRSSRPADQFLSIAPHELRTPLTSLLGYATMLQAGLDDEHHDGAVRQRQAAAIVRQTLRLDTLIGHLLDVTRLQRGQFTLVEAVFGAVKMTCVSPHIGPGMVHMYFQQKWQPRSVFLLSIAGLPCCRRCMARNVHSPAS